MSTVFLSYSRNDRFFAGLAQLKLEKVGLQAWMDRGRVRPGDDWRHTIDQGIAESFAVVLALSPSSSTSHYVTYEWAAAMGKGKPIVPVLLDACDLHPKLEIIQHLDFSTDDLPWSKLVERLREIMEELEAPEAHAVALDGDATQDDQSSAAGVGAVLVKKIRDYLDKRGLQLMSFERIRERIDDSQIDEQLELMIKRNSDIFRYQRIMGGKPGLMKI